jgi:hypothetical protein
MRERQLSTDKTISHSTNSARSGLVKKYTKLNKYGVR